MHTTVINRFANGAAPESPDAEEEGCGGVLSLFMSRKGNVGQPSSRTGSPVQGRVVNSSNPASHENETYERNFNEHYDYVLSKDIPRSDTLYGHAFVSVNLHAPTWCDNCGDFIWGVYKKCLICTNCQYTCHQKCSVDVELYCSHYLNESYRGQVGTSLSIAMLKKTSDANLFQRSPSKRRLLFDMTTASASFRNGLSNAEDITDSGYQSFSSAVWERTSHESRKKSSPGLRTLTRHDLTRRIEAFNRNSHISHGLLIELPNEDNTFQGAVRVHMNLIRPIHLCSPVKQTFVDDASTFKDALHENVQVSFYLPQGTTTVIHVTSHTTAHQVIHSLLSKFKIADNPRKFALYEKNQAAHKPVTMRRMMEEERPLPLLLCWADEGVRNLEYNKFVLQENDTGEILWEAFSLPELENFLCVLNREEDEYIEQMKTKFRLKKLQLQKRLKEKEPSDQRTPIFV